MKKIASVEAGSFDRRKTFRGSPLFLALCLVLSLAVHAAIATILMHALRPQSPSSSAMPLMCELVSVPTAPAPPNAQTPAAMPPAGPKPVPIAQKRRKKKPAPPPKAPKPDPKPTAEVTPRTVQHSARPSARTHKKTHVFKERAPSSQQQLDTLPKQERTVVRKITEKHSMTWRSMIAPQYVRSDFVGHYTVGPGHFISIMGSPHTSNRLFLFDSQTGKVHRLKQKEALHFTYGPDSKHDSPVMGVVIFMPVKEDMDQNPLVCWTSRLMWIPEDSVAIMADKVKLDETEVIFFNKDNVISGELIQPRLDRPTSGSPTPPPSRPGIIWVHGPGCAPQLMATGLARLMAAHGYAFLAFKSRGCGDSSGNHITSSTTQLASDVLAAHAFLSRSEGVDPEKITVWGSQQGCVPAYLACARLSRIAACVLTILPPMPSAEGTLLPDALASITFTARHSPTPTLVIAEKGLVHDVHAHLKNRQETKFIAIDCGCQAENSEKSPHPAPDQLAPSLAGAVSSWLKSQGGS